MGEKGFGENDGEEGDAEETRLHDMCKNYTLETSTAITFMAFGSIL